jgi:hypothetical protein
MDFDNRFIATVAICSLMAVGIIGFGIYSNSTQNSQKKSTATNKSTRPKTVKKATTNKTTIKSSDTDESDDNDSSNLRGYKQTSSGKTTTYFNRELSASEKSLIGDITPKRIDSPSPAAATSPTPVPTASGSAWNAAGTWEEKNITEWTKQRIKEGLARAVHATAVGKVRKYVRALIISRINFLFPRRQWCL